MTDNVNAVAGSVVNAPDLYRRPDNVPTAPGNELGKDEFLQLLVAQLKYQDPLEPSSSEEFISTTAQFTVVEKLDELTKQGESSALVQSLTTASSLVGREITANMDGVLVDAVVDHSRIVGGEVVLDSDAGEIRLNQIVSVGAVPSSTLAPTVDPSVAATESTAAGAAAVDETVTDENAAAGEPASSSIPAEEADPTDGTAPAESTVPPESTAPVDDIVPDVDTVAAEDTIPDSDAVPAGDPTGADEAANNEPVIVIPDSGTDPATPSDTQAVPVAPPVVDGPSAAPTIQPDDIVVPPIETAPTVDPDAGENPIVADPVTAEPSAPAPTEPIDPVADEATQPEPVDTEPVDTEPVDPQPVAAPVPDTTDNTGDTADTQPAPLADPAVVEAIQALSDPAIAEAVQLLSNPAVAEAVRVLSDPAVRDALGTVTDADLNAIAALASSPLFAALAEQEPEIGDDPEAPIDVAQPFAVPATEVSDPFDPFDPLG